MATYDKIKNKTNNHQIQVQSAIEDGSGHVIENTYLKQEGYYPSMTAGLSDNLKSKTTLYDNNPYLKRTAGGSLEVGNKCYEKNIVGGTVVFNQLVRNGIFGTTDNWVPNISYVNFTVGNNKATIVHTRSAADSIYQAIQNTIAGHKYLIKYDAWSTDENKQCGFTCGGISKSFVFNITTSKQNYAYIFEATTAYNILSIMVPYETTYYFENVNLIDLTQTFGSTIADYIFTLETNSAGTGIAWYKQFFPKDYYAYDAGSLLSVNITGKKIIGFNAYNNGAGNANLLGGHQYQITGTYTSLAFQDINGNTGTFYPDANGKFTPNNDCTVLVVGGNSTDTCIHLVWDGERNGDFEPYYSKTYSVDETILRGVIKLDGNNHLFYEGDTYASDGAISKKFGTKTLSAAFSVGDTVSISDIANGTTDVLCDKYGALSEWGVINGTTITLTKALAIGDTILYKLATEAVINATAFTELQDVNNWGTEEWLDARTIPMPVGHISEYLPDLKAKIEVAPVSPETEGYYVMKRDNGVNSYSPLVTWLIASGYAKKEEIGLTNFGTITATALVGGAYYRNDIAVSGGVNDGDVIYIKTSANVVYPVVNNGATLTVFCASDLSSASIVKAWKL